MFSFWNNRLDSRFENLPTLSLFSAPQDWHTVMKFFNGNSISFERIDYPDKINS